ncbi:hypothetical protein BFN03_04885 [Rhodococcus sp. WMMA185]|uniref:hypothetical protein n=1 Tax=Rhodococcus sp. WMMA185 TaxID=679318 RepID=UPI000878A87E|nr:hypothetical protein [Rhodococcus sp. WMMA185]AOW92269.1 hypothetical protein BFN03_04885 [Rhodococcus sp. WMMA185]
MTEDQPRRGLDRLLHGSFVPAKLFGGRVRTSTLALCTLWVALYSLHAYLNPTPLEPIQGPVVPAVVPTGQAPTPTYTLPPQPTEMPTTTESVPETQPPEETPEPTQTLPFGIPNPFAPTSPSGPPTSPSGPMETETPPEGGP